MASFNFKYGSINASFKNVLSAKFTKNKNAISKMEFQIYSTDTFVIDDTINFYNQDETLKFSGLISKAEINLGIWNLEVQDLGVVLTTQRFSDVLRNQSPEAMIQYIIETYTTLTFVSSVSTGLTISKQVFRDSLIIDAIDKLLELFNGTFNIDKNGNFNLIRNSSSTSSLSISNGIDSLQGKWKTDANKKYTKIIVEGSVITQRQTETVTGTGTEFILSAIPKDIQIVGFVQTTETITGDYEVDAQDKKITFNSSQTNPVVNYSYDSLVKVELGEGRTLKLQKTYLETPEQALELTLSALALYQDGVQSSTWLKSGTADFEDVTVGQNINVVDTNNNISGTFEVQKVTYEYPNKLFISVGEDEDSLFEWQKEAQQRIEELEQKDQNSEFITKFTYNINKLNIRLTSRVLKLCTKI